MADKWDGLVCCGCGGEVRVWGLADGIYMSACPNGCRSGLVVRRVVMDRMMKGRRRGERRSPQKHTKKAICSHRS